jgi:homoserine dehydrogenase
VVGLLGPGRVGRAFLDRLFAYPPPDLKLRLVAVADRTGALIAPHGLDASVARSLAAAKAAGRPLPRAAGADYVEGLPGAVVDGLAAVGGVAGAVVVDTSGESTGGLLAAARRQGLALALANKLPLAGGLASWDDLTAAGPPSRWGTTVASSLPVVGAVRSLVDGGDPPLAMHACLSGTAGLLLEAVAAGGAAGAALLRAVASGACESDPRRDLDGADLAAKALVLARSAGFRLEMADVVVRPLFALAAWPQEASALAALVDDASPAMRARLRASGGKLRYMATLSRHGIEVGLGVPPRELAAIPVTSSAVRIESALFGSRPLLLAGRGGGPPATAAGLLADVVAAARAMALG